MQPLLTVEHLTKVFTSGWFHKQSNKKRAVNNISFQLMSNEILGLLGQNGAGKTTTIQMLLHLLKPTSGIITYFGKDFAKYRSEILDAIGFASSYIRLPKQLSLEENLLFFARMYDLHPSEQKERVATCLRSFQLWDMRHQKAATLSSGQATKLMLAKAFLARPKIVLLDEPTATLDPASAHEIRSCILEQREQHGVSFLFASHNMTEVTQVCDRVLVLKSGTIIADNTPEELTATISLATILLLINENAETAVAYCQEQNITHQMNGNDLACEVQEQQVAHFLQALTRLGVSYSQIYIKKPQLEDYFIQMSKG